MSLLRLVYGPHTDTSGRLRRTMHSDARSSPRQRSQIFARVRAPRTCTSQHAIQIRQLRRRRPRQLRRQLRMGMAEEVTVVMVLAPPAGMVAGTRHA